MMPLRPNHHKAKQRRFIMAKQTLKRLALAALIGAAALFSASAFAALEAGGCSLTEISTEEDIVNFVRCVRNSSLSQECKVYHRFAVTIYCVNEMGAGFCIGGFGRGSEAPDSIVQLFSNLSPCSISKEEWVAAKNTGRTAEIVRRFATCTQPEVERFGSQHGC